MINFKYAIVKEELKHLLQALQDPSIIGNPEKCDEIMQRYAELREVQSLMAKRLGDRVVLNWPHINRQRGTQQGLPIPK